MKNRLVPWTLVIALALFVALSSQKQWFQSLELVLYDALVSKTFLSVSDDIILIEIDDESLSALGAWPWGRDIHARLLSQLSEAEAVIFDVVFAEAQSENIHSHRSHAEGGKTPDQALAEAIRQHGRVVLPVYINQSYNLALPVEVLPLSIFADSGAMLGHVQIPFDQDGIARFVFLHSGVSQAFWPQLSLAGIQAASQQPIVPQPLGENKLDPFQVIDKDKKYFRFVGEPNTVARVSYSDVVSGRVPPEQWQGKFVLIGATALGLGDYIPTPVGYMSGVELHANILHAIQQQGFIKHIPQKINALSLALAFLLVAALAVRLSPRQFLAATLVFIVIAFAVSIVGFLVFSRWITILPFCAGVAILYPLWSWRRIEIALRFLQRELQGLKDVQSNTQLVDLNESVAAQLAGLEQVGVVQDWRLLKANNDADIYSWPKYNYGSYAGRTLFHTVYEFAGQKNNLNFSTVLSEDKTVDLVATVLSQKRMQQSAVENSFELVEQTIKEIRDARQEVEHLQRRMNSSMALLQDAVLLSDLSGRIVFKNDAADTLFADLSLDESVASVGRYFSGKLWPGICYRLLVEDDPIYQELNLSADANHEATAATNNINKILLCQARKLEMNLQKKDDQAPHQFYLYIFTDVSKLREAEQSKREMLAFLSHDMRSPIVSQLATITRARESGVLDGSYSEVLDKLERFGRKNLKYTEDFLQLTRAENIDKKEFYLVDLHGVIDGAVAEQQGFALQKNIQIKIERSASDAWVDGDAQLLERAVSNLLANAIQHSDEKTEVVVQLKIDAEAMISVIDQGVGMSAEARQSLLEPGFRKRHSAKKEVGGRAIFGVNSYGLGLSFVHTVVTRHGGRIDIVSRSNVGTEFKLYFNSVVPE